MEFLSWRLCTIVKGFHTCGPFFLTEAACSHWLSRQQASLPTPTGSSLGRSLSPFLATSLLLISKPAIPPALSPDRGPGSLLEKEPRVCKSGVSPLRRPGAWAPPRLRGSQWDPAHQKSLRTGTNYTPFHSRQCLLCTPPHPSSTERKGSSHSKRLIYLSQQDKVFVKKNLKKQTIDVRCHRFTTRSRDQACRGEDWPATVRKD